MEPPIKTYDIYHGPEVGRDDEEKLFNHQVKELATMLAYSRGCEVEDAEPDAWRVLTSMRWRDDAMNEIYAGGYTPDVHAWN